MFQNEMKSLFKGHLLNFLSLITEVLFIVTLLFHFSVKYFVIILLKNALKPLLQWLFFMSHQSNQSNKRKQSEELLKKQLIQLLKTKSLIRFPFKMFLINSNTANANIKRKYV